MFAARGSALCNAQGGRVLNLAEMKSAPSHVLRAREITITISIPNRLNRVN
jgi:hypothetical protein